MRTRQEIDGLIVQWGDRLFYPDNRSKRASSPRLRGHSVQARAAALRARIAATVVRRAPQVMVKVTGGGRGMRAIAAHFRYISKNGKLDIEDERGTIARGKEDVSQLLDDWRWGGSPIDDEGHRREAFNIMLSMPRGTDPLRVQCAAREFATSELADHKYVMVLHDHQANPHVHLSVRAESIHGKRLNPRKEDLSRWRETFAANLRGWGIEAEASSRHVLLQPNEPKKLWRIKAQAEHRLRGPARPAVHWPRQLRIDEWNALAELLSSSSMEKDTLLATAVRDFLVASARPDPVAQRRDGPSHPGGTVRAR